MDQKENNLWWQWKCKPLAWLWGLIPLALLAFIAIYSERSAMEADLKTRSLEALRNAGMDWADPSFTGRDGVIFGKALSPEEKQIAIDALRDVHGVRVVNDGVAFLRPVSPYLWSAEKSKRTLVLSGYVPSLQMRDALIAKSKTLFPTLSVQNKMEIASGTPKRVQWEEATGFGLEQVKRLTKGSVHFEDSSFTIKGDAKNSKSFQALSESLDVTLPKGIRLHENLVNPPMQSPFVMLASKDDDRITLTGYVPNKATRNFVADLVTRKFPDHTLNDKTHLASGEPAEWNNTLRVAFSQLVLLDYGEAKFVNKKVTIKGRAPTQSLVEKISDSLKSALPQKYYFDNKVVARKNSARGSSWRGNQSGRYAQDRNDRDRDRRPDRDNGRDQNRDQDNHRDRGRDQDQNQNGKDSGFGGFEKGYDTTKESVKKISPYIWSLTKKNDALLIGGYVVSESLRDKILRQAKHSYPDYQVIDNMKIGAGGLGEDKHMMVADFAFQRVLPLEYGILTLRDDEVRLRGQAREGSYKLDEMADVLLPKGVTLANAYIRPGKVKDYRWEVTRNGNDIIMSGFVENDDMKQEIIKTAKKAFSSLNIIDKMKAASGVPNGLDWLDGMEFCIKQLDGLKDGTAGLHNRGYHLVGMAWSFEDQKSLNQAKAYIPAGFNLDYQRIELPRVSPFVWRIDYQAQRVTLSGNVPGQRAKQELVLAVEERFPGATIIDQLEIAGGAPEGWINNAKVGVYAVSRLGRGSVTYMDQDMTVRGVAANDFVKKEIGEELSRSLAREVQLENRVRVEAVDTSFGGQDSSAYEDRRKEYGRISDAELDSDSRVKASTCERYLNVLVNKSSIIFSAASAKLSSKSDRVLKRLAFVANRCEDTTIEVAGHTDSDGSKQFNRFLSMKRARAVAEFLVNRGVNKDRLVAVGYGETRPVVPNNSEENKRKNRRIEFVVKDRE